jgi:hypothetical protein
MLGSDDGPGGDDLRDLRNGTRDWGKGRVYILYAITDANTIQAVVVHHTIHQSISTPTGYSLCTRRHPHSSNNESIDELNGDIPPTVLHLLPELVQLGSSDR